MKLLIPVLRFLAATILFQTLFFKFTGAPESVFIFEKLGVGIVGRIGSGIIELIVGILILMPKTTKLGSLGAIGVMTGAVMAHLFILGIEVQGDGGLLFALAITVILSSFANLYLTKKKIQILSFQI